MKLIPITLSLLAAVSASAQTTLLEYTFESPAGSSTSTNAPTMEATSITGSTFQVLDDDDNSLEFSTFASDTAQRSIFEFASNETITANTAPYWYFTLTPADTADLDSISFAIGRSGSGTFTASYNVSSSLDSHASLLSVSDFAYSAANDEMSAPSNQTITLGSSFENISSPITFRIYYADSSSSGGTGARIDTVSVSGTAIPEPSTYAALAGLSILLLTVCLCSRNKQS